MGIKPIHSLSNVCGDGRAIAELEAVMKATITHAEWQYVAKLAWWTGSNCSVGVEDIERRIALTLGREPGTDPDADVITDAVAGAW